MPFSANVAEPKRELQPAVGVSPIVPTAPFVAGRAVPFFAPCSPNTLPGAQRKSTGDVFFVS